MQSARDIIVKSMSKTISKLEAVANAEVKSNKPEYYKGKLIRPVKSYLSNNVRMPSSSAIENLIKYLDLNSNPNIFVGEDNWSSYDQFHFHLEYRGSYDDEPQYSATYYNWEKITPCMKKEFCRNLLGIINLHRGWLKIKLNLIEDTIKDMKEVV